MNIDFQRNIPENKQKNMIFETGLAQN